MSTFHPATSSLANFSDTISTISTTDYSSTSAVLIESTFVMASQLTLLELDPRTLVTIWFRDYIGTRPSHTEEEEEGSVTILVAMVFLPLINKHQPLDNVMCNIVNHSLTA